MTGPKEPAAAARDLRSPASRASKAGLVGNRRPLLIAGVCWGLCRGHGVRERVTRPRYNEGKPAAGLAASFLDHSQC